MIAFERGAQDRYDLERRRCNRIPEERGVPHPFALHPGDRGDAGAREVLDRRLRFVSEGLATAR